MEQTFKIGEVVQLNSGGPRMTVLDVGSDEGKPYVSCVWFDNAGKGSAKQSYGTFPVETVQLAS